MGETRSRCLNTFFIFIFSLFCVLNTYTHAHLNPYQWISFILYFLDFRQRFVAAALKALKWVRCLKFFFWLSLSRFCRCLFHFSTFGFFERDKSTATVFSKHTKVLIAASILKLLENNDSVFLVVFERNESAFLIFFE